MVAEAERVIQEMPLAFAEVFRPPQDEVEVYRLLLLGAFEMDGALFEMALEKGGRSLLRRYSEEENVFGVQVFQRDLSEVRKRYFAHKTKEEFYRYILSFSSWSSEHRLHDLGYWVGDLPEFPRYRERAMAYCFAASYRYALGTLPKELREVLEPVARLIADYRAKQEYVWTDPALTQEQKEAQLAQLYAETKERIGDYLIPRGLPPTLASPGGFSSELVAQGPLGTRGREGEALRPEGGGRELPWWVF